MFDASPFFLDGARPLLPSAAEALLAGWKGGTADLSHVLVLVPTGHSGRRLRAALAAKVAEKNAVLLPPKISTPEGIFDLQEASGSVATPCEALLAWRKVLLECDLENFREVFPSDPPAQDSAWAMQVAAEFLRLGRALGENGLDFDTVSRRLGAGFGEGERWRQLAKLEAAWVAELKARGMQDAERARITSLRSLKLPPEINRVVLLAVPDPLPVAILALEELEKRAREEEADFRISVWIHAAGAFKDGFDGWGRPLPSFWEEHPMPFLDAKAQIKLLPRPTHQAEEVARRLAQGCPGGAAMAVGVVDAEILPHLETRLEAAGIAAFNPEGLAFSQHSLHWMLCLLGELLGGRSFRAFEQLLRVPDFHAAVEAQIDERWPGAKGDLQEACDALHDRHLPHNIDFALRAARENTDDRSRLERLGGALQITTELLANFEREAFSVALRRWLEFAFSRRSLISGDGESQAFRQAAEAVLQKLEEVEKACAAFASDLEPAHKLDLLLHLLRATRLFPERSQGSQDLLGWLELAYEDAPFLVLAGFNEGRVPTSIHGDPWLPHGMREALGMKTNAERHARDAYLLCALLGARSGAASQVMVLAGRESSVGDPLKPSRLLLQCTEAELPQRVAQLFPDQGGHDVEPPIAPAWERAWRLTPPPSPDWEPKKLSATEFRAYLDCPFRYYLRYVLQMESVEADKEEMDSRDFGNLVHQALEALAREASLAMETDPVVLAEFLKEKAERYVHGRYGNDLSVPLLVQLESAKARLAAAAELHAASRKDGWRIRHVEVGFDALLGGPLRIDGVEIRGRIDHIEQHECTGAWRILDYKTGEMLHPEEAHLRPQGRTPRELKAWQTIHHAGKDQRWTDLQLPLYLHVARQALGPNVTVAYFNLPRASSKTNIVPWNDLSNEPALLESALRCAQGVIDALRRGRFWPPVEKPDFDDFAHLFFHGVLESVDPTDLSAAKFGELFQG